MVKIKKIRITKPYLERNNFNGELSFKKENKKFEPSSGGIGSKLKTPKLIFTKTIISNPTIRESGAFPVISGRTLKKNPKTKASKKLLKGPAKPTNPYCFLGFLRLNGLTGTGLAIPKTGAPERNKINGNKIEYIGSICRSGFRVNLPASLAVVSPNLSATAP